MQVQFRSQTSGQDNAKLKCGASLVYNSTRPRKKNSSTTWLCTSPWTQISRTSDTWVQSRKRGMVCITNSKRVTPTYCQAGTYLLPSLLVFGVRLRLRVALELLGDPCLYYGLQHFYSSSRQSRSTPRHVLSELKMSSTRETTASNSYRLVPRTTGANTVQQKLLKSKRFQPHQRKGNPVKLPSDGSKSSWTRCRFRRWKHRAKYTRM